MAGRPAGSQNKDKPYRDALRRAIARAQDNGGPHTLDRIAERHLAEAAGGDIGAMKELADRLDGKVPQGIGGDAELPDIKMIVTGVPRASD
jgi:hypothetical protein